MPRALRGAVGEIVRRQIELGIDVIDDGEFGKPSFVSYVNERLGGFEIDNEVPRGSPGRARAKPNPFRNSTPRAMRPRGRTTWSAPRPSPIAAWRSCERDIDNLKAALDGAKPAEVFMPAISPTSAADWQRNGYYKTEEEYLFAIADALREEYEAIVQAGFLVQIDDPHLVTYWIKEPELDASRSAANGPRCGSRRSIMRCATSRRKKSATTPATASIWARACTTWSSSTSSTSF